MKSHCLLARLALSAVLAGCNRGPIDADILIENVTVIDGTDRPAAHNVAVAITGDRIVRVGTGSPVSAPVKIDGTGKYLIPGLWDMHVHLVGYGEHSFPLFLANGVTTIRELGGNLASLLWLRQETRFGRLLGPDLLISGPSLHAEFVVRAAKGSPNSDGMAAVTDPSGAVAIVDSLSRVGVDQIKVHGMMSRAAYFAIVDRAKELEIPVVGHIPDSVMPEEAVKAGHRTIEHNSRLEVALSSRGAEITQWMLAAMEREVQQAGANPRIGPIFALRLAAADSAVRTFDQRTATTFAERAARSQVWFDPTLAVTEVVYRLNEPEIRNRPELKYVPRSARAMDEGLTPAPNPSGAEIEDGRRKWNGALRILQPLIAAGARIVAGTDVPVFPLVPGFSLHRELSLLVQAGLSPQAALQAATRNAAEAAGRLDDVGTIEKGKVASLVLLDGDPLANIANTARIHAVIARGRLLDRATLDRMLIDAETYAAQR